MSSVTINGHTYTDDADPSTGMAAGGHRTRFIPALADFVVAAGDAVDAVEADRAEVAANTATVAADKATVAADKATVAADKATVAADKGIVAADKAAAAASAAAALVSEQNATVISESGLPSQSGKAGYVLGTNGTATEWTPAIISLTYANRSSLRTNETGKYAIVDGLGLFLFQYITGNDDPDDDETCFATTNGRWLLQAAHIDVVDNWLIPEISALQDRILFGTADCAITSITATTQTSFTGTMTGAAVGDRVIANPPDGLGARISYYAGITSTNTVTVYLNNPSATTQTIVVGTWAIAVIKEF